MAGVCGIMPTKREAVVIDLRQHVYFFDDRSKDKTILQLTKVLHRDKEYVLGVVSGIDEPILFSRVDHTVKNSTYDSWLATNKKD